MSLNKFFNTGTGLDIDLRIGADEVKANNMQTQNIDTFTINGVPYLPGSGVTNPLTSNLKLDGFAIIEELASSSPSLNIDQLNNTKDIKLKIGGISKVDVKNNEITLNENLNMDNHEIKNVSVIDNSSGAIQIIGSSTTSAVEVDPNPSIGVNLTTSSKDINIISSNDLLLKSVSSILDVDSNLIRFISTGVPQGQIDAVGGWELANTLNMTNNNIINVNTSNTQQTQTELIVKPTAGQLPITATNGVLLTENNLPGGEIFESNVTENKSYKTLNMNSNNIDNVPQVSNGVGNLLLTSNAVGVTATLGATISETTTNMFVAVANNAVTIAKSNDPSPPSGIATFTTSAISTDLGVNFEINGAVIYVRPNSMPNFFVGDTTYIFVGNRSTSNSYTLPDNCKIRGLGKNNSRIDFNGGGTLFSSVDANISVADITLTSSNTTGKLFDLSNVAKDKTIDMTGLQIRNTYNGMLIDGYDLVDMLNCVFTYFQSGSPTPVGIKMSNNSKVQFTSCEFLRWFQEGGTPATTAFVGNMLEFNTSVNAYNITSSFFHPQYDQNGILFNVTSTIEGIISANTFIDINLNTGGGFLVLNIPPVVATNAIVESNSIYPNLKSQVTYVLSAVNTVATDLSVTNPNVINHNNLALPLAIQFATIGTNGLITYTKKRTSNFMIVATCNFELVAGTNNRVGLGLFVNGVAVPLAYSFVNLSASGTANQKSVTLSFTGTANQNDTFQLSVFNSTTNNNVIVSDINFAGIEI